MCVMGVVEVSLCVFVAHFVCVFSVAGGHDVTPFNRFPGLFPHFDPFPFDGNLEFSPHDGIFSSWKTWDPEFHLFPDWPSITTAPRIHLFCNESHLSVEVDKRLGGVTLAADEVQLGDDCYSNGQRANQFVFIYSVDECGTSRALQDGLLRFSNSLRLNLQKPLPSSVQIPSTVHISCMPRRTYLRAAAPEGGRIFYIRAMNPSWTNAAETRVYKRGQVVNVQVSARTEPRQQLFIQKCFVSAFPNPQATPRHAIIMNKGCTVPLGSVHPVVRFLPSGTADEVNFVLNTTYLISQLYVHCSVLVTDQSVDPGLKSCNYNLIQSRWEDLAGDVQVCECCSTKCKGPAVRHLIEGHKATVSTGPFVIVDKDTGMTSEHDFSRQPLPSSVTSSKLSGAAVMRENKAPGGPGSRPLGSPPQAVVVRKQEPVEKVTVWLPGQVEDTKQMNTVKVQDMEMVNVNEKDVSNDLPQTAVSHWREDSNHVPAQNQLNAVAHLWDLNILTMPEGWPIPPQPDDGLLRPRFGRSAMFGSEVPEVHLLLPADVADVDPDLNGDQTRDEEAKWSQEEIKVDPVIRSKLQYSRGEDGTQVLSYEEDVVKQQESRSTTKRCGKERITERRKPRGRLQSAFLDLLRRMDKAE